MKKALGIFLLIVSAGAFGLLQFSQIRSLKDYPTATLEQEKKDLQIQLDALRISNSSLKDARKNQLIVKIASYEIELARRNYAAEWVILFLTAVGIMIIVLSLKKKTREIEDNVRKVKVYEAMPSEVYVDEREFYQKRQDGFTTKEQALIWFETDPLKVCSYCGSQDVKPLRGSQDEVQLITFYKRVPEGAKDLRIILGSFWYVKAASELQCENCKQKVIR